MLGAQYVAGVGENEAFDPQLHARNDFDVSGVVLSKNDELSVWQAEITVRNPDGGIFAHTTKRRVHISQEIEGVLTRVFTGRIEGWPIGPAGREVKLIAMGRPFNTAAVEAAALAGVNDDPWGLFLEPGAARNSENVLSARHAALNWRRDDAPPQLVDLVAGQGYLDLDQRYVEGSLQFEQLGQPIDHVDVVLKAQWAQAYLKGVSVSDAMPADGRFGTIAPPDWKDFPKVGSKIGDWSVLRSGYEDADPGADPIYSDFYAADSSTNKQLSTSTAPSHQMRFKRRFYQVSLLLAAVLTARRTETVRFRVSWAGQRLSGYEGAVETLQLDVRNLDIREDLPEFETGAFYDVGDRFQADGLRWEVDTPFVGGATIWSNFDNISPVIIEATPLGGPVMPQFFGAPSGIDAPLPNGNHQFYVRDPNPGLSAILHAFNRARAKILDGNRLVRASFDTPWPYVKDLHGGEIVRIAGSEVPGGEMIGKVVRMNINLTSGIASITIASMAGNGASYPVPQQPAYANPVLDTYGVVKADIVNDHVEQEAAIAANQHPVKTDLVGLAESLSTSFDIELSGVPRGADLSVDLPMGIFFVDSVRQVTI